ncbi:transposase [Paraburkholderia phymatum]|uniref:Transposase n=1 Tax=Paraburkholderia phymatum TaxID=148447 RepID=A0ACC6U8W1_9BURK
MKYTGIDLHSNNAVVAVIDDQDRVLYCKRLANDLSSIIAVLAPFREDLQGVVVESTYNWYWLVDGLMAAGFAVHLANTAAIKQYEGLKYAGDERDAVFLAHIFRLGLLPEGYIYPPQERGLRDLARKRMQLVQQSTLNTISIENILARQLNLHLNAEQVRHLDSAARDCTRLAAAHRDCPGGKSRGPAHPAGANQGNRVDASSRSKTASGVRDPRNCTRNRTHTRDHDHAGDGHHFPFPHCRPVQFLLPVR